MPDDYEEITIMRTIPHALAAVTAAVEAFAKETTANPAAESTWFPVVNQLVDAVEVIAALPDEPVSAHLATAAGSALAQLASHAAAGSHVEATKMLGKLVDLGVLARRIAALPK